MSTTPVRLIEDEAGIGMRTENLLWAWERWAWCMGCADYWKSVARKYAAMFPPKDD